jgi:hypothetical protein
MELASMLAGEPFSDRPECVCPVLGAFLRTYNDRVDDRRRQDLYRCASASVGTSGDDAATEDRARLALEWTRTVHGRRSWIRRHFGPRPRHANAEPGRNLERIASEAAAISAGSPGEHEATLAFIDELIAAGRGAETLLPPRFDVADISPGCTPVEPPARSGAAS